MLIKMPKRKTEEKIDQLEKRLERYRKRVQQGQTQSKSSKGKFYESKTIGSIEFNK